MNETTQSANDQANDESVQATPVLTNAQFKLATIAIGENVKKGNETSRVHKAFVEYGYPTLDQVAEGVPAPDSFKDEVVEGGGEKRAFKLPVYADQKLAYAQDAIIAACQTNARNRAKTDINDIPTDWVTLLESRDSSKFGTQLKELKEQFAIWLADSSGLSESHAAVVLGLVDIRKLSGMDFAKRQKIGKLFQTFVDSGIDTSSYTSALNSLVTVLTKEDEDLGFLD